MRSSILIAATALALIVASQAGSQAPREPAVNEVQVGLELYYDHCAVCHGVMGRGDGPLTPDLRTPPSDLTLIAARRGGVFPEEEIVEFMDGRRQVRGHGPANMPVWGRKFGESVAGGETAWETRAHFRAIVVWLKTIQVKQ
jgi:mono/diheme cytochrome c family protein